MSVVAAAGTAVYAKNLLNDDDKFKKILGMSSIAAVASFAGTYMALRDEDDFEDEDIIKLNNKISKVEADNKKSGVIDKATGFYKKYREYTREEDAYAVNPGFYTFDERTTNNCVLCTIAYDLRRRGYAVSANYAQKGFTIGFMGRMYKDPITKLCIPDRPLSGKTTAKEFVEFLDGVAMEQPPGSRGYLTVQYKIYGEEAGHAMAYEVRDRGVIDIIDAQTNTIIRNVSRNGFGKRSALFENGIRATVTRLDNLEINTDNIKEVAH